MVINDQQRRHAQAPASGHAITTLTMPTAVRNIITVQVGRSLWQWPFLFFVQYRVSKRLPVCVICDGLWLLLEGMDNFCDTVIAITIE